MVLRIIPEKEFRMGDAVNTIELGEGFKTSRAVLKVLTILSRLFSNASWLTSSPTTA